jgi:hypothetical protein
MKYKTTAARKRVARKENHKNEMEKRMNLA